MGLGLIIPVRDDGAALGRLLAAASALQNFERIIVVDDASDVPVETALAEVIRQDVATGAGSARNRGLAEIGTDHVLFFDSDDMITPELVPLWHDLAGREFDFCLFRHADSRRIAGGHWHQMPHDDALWRLAGMGGQHLAPVSEAAAPWLAQTANYPWNKVYRTGFLREAGIVFPDLKVHNDIAPHWQSFAAAQRILASDRVCATHVVHAGGSRLTNARGRERIEAAASLRQVGAPLRGPLRAAFQHFASGLFDWIHHNVDPDLQPELMGAMRRFWLEMLRPGDEARLIREDPVLALRVALQMAGGRVPC